MTDKNLHACIWLRNDLRIADNPALFKAASAAENGLLALFVIAPETWLRHNWSACKVDFILRQLQHLQDELAKLNVPLKIISVVDYAEIPKAVGNFCRKNNISKLFANEELLLDEIKRDQLVARELATHNISFNILSGAMMLSPKLSCKANGDPFKIFTPFKRNWLKQATPDMYLTDFKKIHKQKPIAVLADEIPKSIKGFASVAITNVTISALWPVGEAYAKKKLHNFIKNKVKQYKDGRDFPALEATSKLSPYLASGIISARQCLTMLCDEYAVDSLNAILKYQGVATWIDELLWREFYYTIALLFPKVVRHEPFQDKYKNIPWEKSEKIFIAWCAGNTGYPIVDAAMRQLNATGWMHNRLRMVTAMFLTKILFIDWRWGEDYFMQNLIDGDFAANNGGWQWSASTGTDAVPYFRIFNPTTQSERFDPKGEFIRRYCPELKDCNNKEIHNPSRQARLAFGYPDPIVDYKTMRAKTIAIYKAQ
jgi:deoxyribodipyrimidine photo-lyase